MIQKLSAGVPASRYVFEPMKAKPAKIDSRTVACLAISQYVHFFV